MRTTFRSVLVGLAAGCNAVYGLDPTVAVNDRMRTVVFDNSASKIDLVDFPVLVALDPARIAYDEVTDPKTQLRFFDPDTGADLAFEIERWDPAGRSDIWVEVPQIDARSTTDHIQMYFGPEAGGLEQPSDVWSAYAFVYHGAPSKLASSVGNFPGVISNVTLVDGVIASAPRFADRTESSIVFANTAPLLNGWDRFTLELWLYPDYPPTFDLTNREPQFVSNDATMTLGRLLVSEVDTLANHQIDVHFEAETSYLPSQIQRQAWGYTVYTFDGQVMWIHRNGTPTDIWSFGVTTRLLADPGRLVLGSTSNSMAGMIDEVRVSPSEMPADWVHAQFLSMTGRFVTVSVEGRR